MSGAKLKKLPVLLTDEEAERFIDAGDLSEFDLSGFKPIGFEFASKDERVNMRLPREVLERAVQGERRKDDVRGDRRPPQGVGTILNH